jgi:hypothetical protein
MVIKLRGIVTIFVEGLADTQLTESAKTGP